MEHNNLKEKDVVIDIESSGTSSKEDTKEDLFSGNHRGKKLLNKLNSGVLGFNKPDKDELIINSGSALGKPTEGLQVNSEWLIDKNPGGQSEERKPLVEKKRKLTNSRKATKPPRPPRGPSMDASDHKLVKEIYEIAMKKRARTERMKAMKKAKAAKLSSSSSSSTSSTVLATVLTVIVFLVIIFQGFSSRNSSAVMLQGSPEPASETNGLISVQVFNTHSPSDGVAPSSEPSSSVEPLSLSGFSYPG